MKSKYQQRFEKKNNAAMNTINRLLEIQKLQSKLKHKDKIISDLKKERAQLLISLKLRPSREQWFDTMFKKHNICTVCGKTKQTFSGPITYIGEYPFCQCGIVSTSTTNRTITYNTYYGKDRVNLP
jgi:hypothetical protein